MNKIYLISYQYMMYIITNYEKIIYITQTIVAQWCYLLLYFNLRLLDNELRYLNNLFTKLKLHISLLIIVNKCLHKLLLSRTNKLICNYNLVKRLFKYLISLSCNISLKYENCKKLCIYNFLNIKVIIVVFAHLSII